MRVRLFAALGLAVALLATLVALLAPPLQAQTTTHGHARRAVTLVGPCVRLWYRAAQSYMP